eukprot:scaffold1697_cov180-Amphora_coffeaeformis.AAC.1
MEQWGWTTNYYQATWVRDIVEIDGNTLTLAQPIVHPIEAVYGGAHVYKFKLLYNGEDTEIENVGVENMLLDSTYASEDDENHGDTAIDVQRARNGWVRQVTARYFWRGLVNLRRQSYQFTVEDSASLLPKGTLAGGRRYPFVIDDGQSHLVQRCYAKDFRHTFASGSLTPGPNVFVDGSAVDSYNDIGPHERFSTGHLYDNIRTGINPNDDNDNGGEMNVQNRGPSGSGHGWAGVQIMFWNSQTTRWRIHAANGAMSWAIGMKGELGARNTREPEPDGIFQSLGTFVTPRSLYYSQLKDRLGPNSLHSVVLPNQKNGPIWDDLDSWAGIGLFGDAVVSWFDEEASVLAGVPLGIGGMVRDINLLGRSLAYTWEMSTGPGSVAFGNSSSLHTTATFSAVGTYSLSLTASDGTISEVATFFITVEGATPTTSPAPSNAPTRTPSTFPTQSPTAFPSSSPSLSPTSPPSDSPTPEPTTSSPSTTPTVTASDMPTQVPTTYSPSLLPSSPPSNSPTPEPTTRSPSTTPTVTASDMPTQVPTTSSPSATPTVTASDMPTQVPTTDSPSLSHTSPPSNSPTLEPTTSSPSATPT